MSEMTFGRRGGGPRPPFSTPGPQPRPDEPNLTAQLLGFNGRVRRRHYWMCKLALVVGSIASISISVITRFLTPPATQPGALLLILPLLLVALLNLGFAGLLFWANLSAVVRRWHDRGRSGWWALMGLIPVLGWAWQGVECGFLEGTLGPNRFGPSPKGIKGVIR